MRRWLVNFYDTNFVDVAYLIFAAEDAGRAYVLAESVFESGELSPLGELNGFEVQWLAPRPITEGDLTQFLKDLEIDPKAVFREVDPPPAEGGGS